MRWTSVSMSDVYRLGVYLHEWEVVAGLGLGDEVGRMGP